MHGHKWTLRHVPSIKEFGGLNPIGTLYFACFVSCVWMKRWVFEGRWKGFSFVDSHAFLKVGVFLFFFSSSVEIWLISVRLVEYEHCVVEAVSRVIVGDLILRLWIQLCSQMVSMDSNTLVRLMKDIEFINCLVLLLPLLNFWAGSKGAIAMSLKCCSMVWIMLEGRLMM